MTLFSSCKSFIKNDIGIDIDIPAFFFQRVSREAPKLPIKSTFADRISLYLFRFTNGVESSWKKQRDISRAITKLGVLAILRGNIEDATTRKFMAGTKESNIVVASEPMCLPPAIPAGRIETAKVVGTRRRNVSLGIRNERCARISGE